MSSVCRRWRSVALSFPELWSKVDVSLHIPDRSFGWHQGFLPLSTSDSAKSKQRLFAAKMSLLNLQLHRAGGYKLHVKVYGDDMMRYALPCIDLIRTRIQRWRSLDLLSPDLYPESVHHLIRDTPSFDSLESLSVRHIFLEQFYKLSTTEPKMPLLRTFYTRRDLKSPNSRSSVNMPSRLGAWSRNVETIICENFLCWFPLFKNARNLIITTTMKRKKDDTEPMNGLSQMPGVHEIGNIISLTFDINVDTHNICWFGEHFRFPNLLHLKISYHKDVKFGPESDGAQMVYMRYPFQAAYVENLLQSSPSLSSLTLNKIPMRKAQVLAFLTPLTSLTRLSIHEPTPCLYGIPIEPLFVPYYPISQGFIEALSNNTHLLPHLKSLELVWRHNVNECALLEMIEHRREMNLEDVSLGTRYPAPEMMEETRLRLKEIREMGLRVQVLRYDISPILSFTQPSTLVEMYGRDFRAAS
ncbi:uncharacterized protein EV420DRAFT_1535874 [Desarmillaria tabescens]|uniref:F-box domain-containing protein n=1 Tax=Armillaria tabescens TaxID=1929756 RepID=A0AA39KG99_ARMTA|nr:uncharacterized protein EV420DRAFT_1535874 [Desarmillaria tabescens]KAK0460253.1 hypothetical protein EV420DRAFT_1535874 [Desarmillaria tabescens]